MLEKNTINSTIMCKAITVVRQMSADERLLRDIQRREETLMNERSALNSARRQGIQEGMEKGIQQRNMELVEKWKKKGFTDEQIKDLLSE